MMDRKRLALIAAICGGLTALGTLLPWVSIDTVMGSMTAAGTKSGLGVFVMILGLVGGAAALLVHLGKTGQFVKLDERQHFYAALGCLGLALILTFVQLVSSDYKTVAMLGEEMGARRGLGLWLDLFATLGGSAAAFLAVKPVRAAGSSTPGA
jgi:hypothetical protein